MKKNKITEVHGWGTLASPTSIDVKADDGSVEQHTFNHLVIGTGATTRLIPGTTLGDRVVAYEEQILDAELPGSIIIAGSGAIGVEFAYVMTNFGVDVTIVEFLDRMVPTEDADVSKELLRAVPEKTGVKVLLGTKVESIEDTPGQPVKVTVSKGDSTEALEADKVLQAIGFAPRIEGYRPREHRRGDRARRDRRRRAGPDQRRERLRDRRRHRQADASPASPTPSASSPPSDRRRTRPWRFDDDDYLFMPARTLLPAADRLDSATDQGAGQGPRYEISVAPFPFRPTARPLRLNEKSGCVKIVADDAYSEILGAHLVGPEVTELLPAIDAGHNNDLTAARDRPQRASRTRRCRRRSRRPSRASPAA